MDEISLIYKILGFIGVTGVLTGYFSTYISTFLPPPSRVARYLGRFLTYKKSEKYIDKGRFSLILCGLEGDDLKESTLRLLRSALNPDEYPMLEVSLSAYSIALKEWYNRKDQSGGSLKADSILRQYTADVIIWGEVTKQGDSVRLFFRGAGRQNVQTLVFDKGLLKEHPDFSLGPVLAAVALAQLSSLNDKDRAEITALLVPVERRLESLLERKGLLANGLRPVILEALCLSKAIMGSHSGNPDALREAIKYGQNSLEGYKEVGDERSLCSIYNNLANALSIKGETDVDDENLRKAISMYEGALDLPEIDALPRQRLTILSNLGSALASLGERQGSDKCLLDALRIYEDVAQAFDKESDPQGWAEAQANIASVLSRIGEREKQNTKLYQAVALHEQALEEQGKYAHTIEWVRANNSLGVALWRLGERENKIELLTRSASCFSIVIECTDQKRLPKLWSISKHNFGAVLLKLGEIQGDTDLIEHSISASKEALQERTLTKSPLDWASTNLSLGQALERLSQMKDDARSLDQAIVCLKAALEPIDGEHQQVLLAKIHGTLGVALKSMGVREKRKDLLKDAIRHLLLASKEFSAEEDPIQCAKYQNDIGLTLRHLAEQNDSMPHFHGALSFHKSALSLFDSETHRYQWIATKCYIANVYFSRGRLENDTDLLRAAIKMYEEAVSNSEPGDNLLDVLLISYNLGIATLFLGALTLSEAELKKSIEIFDTTLNHFTKAKSPIYFSLIEKKRFEAVSILHEIQTL